MSRTVFDALMMGALAMALGGCGLTQSVAESTAETSRAIFYKQVRTLHLDFSPRAALNTDAAALQGLSLPTLVRVYQLRDERIVQRTDYDSLLDQGHDRLGSDLLSEHAVVIRPGQGARLDVALHKDAQFVAIAGLFRQPDPVSNGWRLVLSRGQLDPDRPRVIELLENQLRLRPLDGDDETEAP